MMENKEEKNDPVVAQTASLRAPTQNVLFVFGVMVCHLHPHSYYLLTELVRRKRGMHSLVESLREQLGPGLESLGDEMAQNRR
jgi:hypothetical protein